MISADEKVQYFRHVRRIYRRTRLLAVLFAALPVILLSTALIELRIVISYATFGIPKDLAQYMVGTFVTRFDSVTFTSLPGAKALPATFLKILLLLYYSYFTFTGLALLLGTFLPITIIAPNGLFRIRRRLGRDRELFYGLTRLHGWLTSLSRRYDARTKRKAIRTVRLLDLPGAISPFYRKWQQSTTRMWFSANPLTSDTVRILGSLKVFLPRAIDCLRRHHDIVKLATAVDALSTFACLASLSREKSYRAAGATWNLQERFRLLLEFAEKITQLPARAEAPRGLSRRMYEATSNLLDSTLADKGIRRAAIVAIFGGIVMVAASMLIGIPIATAFLAWFSVTFGSITISVAIGSIRSRSDRAE
jgi:hypothetical protein